MKKYIVTRTDGQTGAVTTCGAPTTERKVSDLRNAMRMSARITQPGNSNSYGIREV